MFFPYDDHPLLVIKNRAREGGKNTTFKHLNLAASIPLIACTMGRAFGDFSISKNEERAFSRAQVIPALKSYRAHIKKDSRLHPIESLQLQPLQKSIQEVGGGLEHPIQTESPLKRLHQCLLKHTHIQAHALLLFSQLHCKNESSIWRDSKTQRINLARPQPSGEGEYSTTHGILTSALTVSKGVSTGTGKEVSGVHNNTSSMSQHSRILRLYDNIKTDKETFGNTYSFQASEQVKLN